MPGAGTIVIHNSKGNASILVDVTQVTFSGNSVIVDPSSDLVAGSKYYVTLDSGVIHDVAGNDYAGISGRKAFNFTADSKRRWP